MFCIQVAPPSFASVSASAQYRRSHFLNRAWRGCEFTTKHDVWRANTYPAPSLQKKDSLATGNTVTGEEALGEKIMFGGFDRHELVYKERFIIRSSEIGANKTASIEAIARLLQDTICNRVQRLGWSADGFPAPPIMRKHRLVWVTSRVHIEMYKYPIWGDVVEIELWIEPDKGIAARLYFMMRNLSTGQVIGRSTSKWLIMNKDTRKLHKISGEMLEEFLAICKKSPRSEFPGENYPILRKVPKLEEPAKYSQLELMPRRADLDINEHVNNVTFYSWLLQSLPQDVVESHELEAITIEYQRECQSGDSVDSLASSEDAVESVNVFHDEFELPNLNMKSEGRQQFLHLLKISGTNCEINRGRTVWRKKHN